LKAAAPVSFVLKATLETSVSVPGEVVQVLCVVESKEAL
jgi:hypothetical protein